MTALAASRARPTQTATPCLADVGIVVVGEEPYSETVGDPRDLSLSPGDQTVIAKMSEQVERLIVIIVSGRPLIVTTQLPKIDALVAAWLPGSEGGAVAEVLFGDYPFTGRPGLLLAALEQPAAL